MKAAERIRKAAQRFLYRDLFSLWTAAEHRTPDGLCRTDYELQPGKEQMPCLICSADGLFNLSTKNRTLAANRPGYEQFRIFCDPGTGAKIGDRVSGVKCAGQTSEHSYEGVVQKAAYYETHIELLITNERLI